MLTGSSVLALMRSFLTLTLLLMANLAIGVSSTFGRSFSEGQKTTANIFFSEHGAPLDRSRALDTVIKNAPEYSMDQYASKVVEKCLKVGGPEFLDRYLDRVCEGRPDRPRIPLIDSKHPIWIS